MKRSITPMDLFGCAFAVVWLTFAGLMFTAMALGIAWLWRHL